jgi:hypothetical protein
LFHCDCCVSTTSISTPICSARQLSRYLLREQHINCQLSTCRYNTGVRCGVNEVYTSKSLLRSKEFHKGRTNPSGHRTAGPQKKLLDRNSRVREGSKQNDFEKAASRADPSPGNGQSRSKSRQRAEQIQVQATGRADSSPGNGQSRFKSRQRAEQIRVRKQSRVAETRGHHSEPVHSVASTQAAYSAK